MIRHAIDQLERHTGFLEVNCNNGARCVMCEMEDWRIGGLDPTLKDKSIIEKSTADAPCQDRSDDLRTR
jgi:hypothetical protein